MRDWLRCEPTVIVKARGAELEDSRGRKYLDANSSIWTNLHGHRHPRMDAAIRRQLGKIAHSSALGLANEPASLLARNLVLAANPVASRQSPALPPSLSKVFFSDNGSTALEVALKLSFEYARRTGLSKRPRFISLQGAYHGDTLGAVSLGHIELFHKAYSPLLFRSDKVMAPYCYRCRFNRAKPQRGDAREYRVCNWECLNQFEQKFAAQASRGERYAGFVFEPLMQGAAGMIPQPRGWLRRAAGIARAHGTLLIADEVMTGFGRTGLGPSQTKESHSANSDETKTTAVSNGKLRSGRARQSGSLFACHQERVQPDFLALAKGLTGGYVPMAATLTTKAVFNAFLGEYEEFNAFFHGHSFTANQVGASAALASLKILEEPPSIEARQRLETLMGRELQQLWQQSFVGDIRQVGLVAGVELVRNWQTREAFDARERAGMRVCSAMARRGVLTRPVGNVIVLMPPYCTTAAQLRRMIAALAESIEEELGAVPGAGRAPRVTAERA
jgi:adenosylmethionine-8-amino-7-oxononanoate aminotransferase